MPRLVINPGAGSEISEPCLPQIEHTKQSWPKKHTHTQTHTHARTHSHTQRHTETHTHTQTRTHTHRDTDTHRHTRTDTHTCTHTHTRARTHTLIHTECEAQSSFESVAGFENWSTREVCWDQPSPRNPVHVCARMLSRVWLFAPPWTVTARLLCLWHFPGKNTGVGCHFLVQQIFLTHGILFILSCIIYSSF